MDMVTRPQNSALSPRCWVAQKNLPTSAFGSLIHAEGYPDSAEGYDSLAIPPRVCRVAQCRGHQSRQKSLAFSMVLSLTLLFTLPRDRHSWTLH
jgi:hypothetical protein